MKLLKNIILSLLSCTVLTCCEEFKHVNKLINISNKSNRDIVVIGSINYPDTLFPLKHGDLGCYIPTGKTGSLDSDEFSRNDIFKNTKFQIFFVTYTIKYTTPADTIRKYKMYEKRLEFTKSELEERSWHIMYGGK